MLDMNRIKVMHVFDLVCTNVVWSLSQSNRICGMCQLLQEPHTLLIAIVGLLHNTMVCLQNIVTND